MRSQRKSVFQDTLQFECEIPLAPSSDVPRHLSQSVRDDWVVILIYGRDCSLMTWEERDREWSLVGRRRSPEVVLFL